MYGNKMYGNIMFGSIMYGDIMYTAWLSLPLKPNANA
jgi:hypothetical protein